MPWVGRLLRPRLRMGGLCSPPSFEKGGGVSGFSGPPPPRPAPTAVQTHIRFQWSQYPDGHCVADTPNFGAGGRVGGISGSDNDGRRENCCATFQIGTRLRWKRDNVDDGGPSGLTSGWGRRVAHATLAPRAIISELREPHFHTRLGDSNRRHLTPTQPQRSPEPPPPCWPLCSTRGTCRALLAAKRICTSGVYIACVLQDGRGTVAGACWCPRGQGRHNAPGMPSTVGVL